MTETQFDYENPFDIMVGAWAGHSISYDPKGGYQFTVPSLCWIHWVDPDKKTRLRYFQEDQGNIDNLVIWHEEGHQEVENTVLTRAFDLIVDGKSCTSDPHTSEAARCKVEGLQSRPGNFIFHLNILPFEGNDKQKAFPGANYYNNQYFINPNERQIIGPYILDDGTMNLTTVIAQTFSRISYHVPEKFQDIEKHHYEKHNLNYEF